MNNTLIVKCAVSCGLYFAVHVRVFRQSVRQPSCGAKLALDKIEKEAVTTDHIEDKKQAGTVTDTS